jgi:hypothetical protein
MNTCKGCKYLFEYGGRGFCGEAVLPAEYVVDPTSGIGGYHERLKYGLDWRSNSTELMTRPGMPCGPDRTLYEHKWFIRVLKKLTSNSN